MVEYDPVKKQIAGIVRNSTVLRKAVFSVLNLIFLRTWYVKRAVKRLGLRKSESINILDAGSGFGQYSYYLAKKYKNADVTGVDLEKHLVDDSNKFVERAGLKNLRFEQGDLVKYQNNKNFDLILSVDVLEHIEDDRTLIHGFSGLLKPGGFLIISTPSLLRAHEHDGSFVGEHFREGYSKEDIEEKLKDAGLAVKKFEYSYGLFGDLSWRLGIRNTMQLASKGRAGMIAGMFYFTLVLIPVLFLMILDFLCPNKQGTGIVVTAEKK